MSAEPCPGCNGRRLKPEALAVRVGGRAIDEVSSETISDVIAFFEDLELSPREQISCLQDLERIKPDVFGPLRGLTMLGMFTHPEHGGNFNKIGWRLIGYVDQYSWAPPFGYYDRGVT